MEHLNFSTLELEIQARSENETIAALAREVLRLRTAIAEHKSASGHELCWLNDVELWKQAGEGPAPVYPHDQVPAQDEFLAQCRRFHESRVKNTPYAEPAMKKSVTEK